MEYELRPRFQLSPECYETMNYCRTVFSFCWPWRDKLSNSFAECRFDISPRIPSGERQEEPSKKGSGKRRSNDRYSSHDSYGSASSTFEEARDPRWLPPPYSSFSYYSGRACACLRPVSLGLALHWDRSTREVHGPGFGEILGDELISDHHGRTLARARYFYEGTICSTGRSSQMLWQMPCL